MKPHRPQSTSLLADARFLHSGLCEQELLSVFENACKSGVNVCQQFLGSYVSREVDRQLDKEQPGFQRENGKIAVEKWAPQKWHPFLYCDDVLDVEALLGGWWLGGR